MDKEKHNDIEGKVWNASGVILDIDSGALIPFCSVLPPKQFVFLNYMHLLNKLHFPTQICQSMKKGNLNKMNE